MFFSGATNGPADAPDNTSADEVHEVMSSQAQTAGTPERGRLAKFFGALIYRFRRLFKKQPDDNPNIYPFF